MENKNRLFYASCFALITTAFSFSIRAGILAQLGKELNFTASQLGFINSMWFLGFPLSMLIGGLVYHTVGPKRIMNFAFFAHPEATSASSSPPSSSDWATAAPKPLAIP
jgi:putative MFS transporter